MRVWPIGWLISISRQWRSGRSGESRSQLAWSNSDSASAKVGQGRDGSPCARAQSAAIEVSSSIATQSTSTSRSNGVSPSRSTSIASAAGALDASASGGGSLGGSCAAAGSGGLSNAVAGVASFCVRMRQSDVLRASPPGGAGEVAAVGKLAMALQRRSSAERTRAMAAER